MAFFLFDRRSTAEWRCTSIILTPAGLCSEGAGFCHDPELSYEWNGSPSEKVTEALRWNVLGDEQYCIRHYELRVLMLSHALQLGGGGC